MDPNLDPGEILLNEGNLTRKPTDDGLLEEFEILQCKSQGAKTRRAKPVRVSFVHVEWKRIEYHIPLTILLSTLWSTLT